MFWGSLKTLCFTLPTWVSASTDFYVSRKSLIKTPWSHRWVTDICTHFLEKEKTKTKVNTIILSELCRTLISFFICMYIFSSNCSSIIVGKRSYKHPPWSCKSNIHSAFSSGLVSTNSWEKYFQLLNHFLHLLVSDCLYAVWCWAGNVQGVYLSLFPENRLVLFLFKIHFGSLKLWFILCGCKYPKNKSQMSL